MTVWVDVVARARGLTGRLLGPRRLAGLLQAHDLRDLDGRLAAARSQPPPEVTAGPRELEESERRRAAAQLRLLAFWCGRRSELLAPLFEDEECRTIRALLRSTDAGIDAHDRVRGLIPTPGLPTRALAQLAELRDVAALAALLAAWGNPYGSALLPEAARQQPDLLGMEQALARTWGTRSRRVSGRAGRAMHLFVERQLDALNGWTALQVAEFGCDGPPEALFLDGGRLIPRDAFSLAASSRNRSGAAAILDALVRHSPLISLTTRDGAEQRVWRALRREQRDVGRLDPLGPAPIIEYWLRLRDEVMTVQRAIWATAAGAPETRRGLMGREA